MQSPAVLRGDLDAVQKLASEKFESTESTANRFRMDRRQTFPYRITEGKPFPLGAGHDRSIRSQAEYRRGYDDAGAAVLR